MLVVNKSDPKEFRYGVPRDVYVAWWELHKRSGLPQTQILHRLVRFVLDQDQVMQGMILGTLDADDKELAELVLKRIAKRPRRLEGVDHRANTSTTPPGSRSR